MSSFISMSHSKEWGVGPLLSLRSVYTVLILPPFTITTLDKNYLAGEYCYACWEIRHDALNNRTRWKWLETLTIRSFPADSSELQGGQHNCNSPCQYRTSITCSWMQSSEETQEFHFHLLNTVMQFLSNSGMRNSGTEYATVLLLLFYSRNNSLQLWKQNTCSHLNLYE